MPLILIHEMTHALDKCYGSDLDDCAQWACSEIRAYAYCGGCNAGGVFLNPDETTEDCIKRKAAAGVATAPNNKCGDGTSYVEAQYSLCIPP